MRAPAYIYQNQDREIEDAGDDFEEYLWMADMETFDKQVLDQLAEEEEMEKCMEEMLAEEEERETVYYLYDESDPGFIVETNLQDCQDSEVMHYFSLLSLQVPEDVDILNKSNLNPDAEEFIPALPSTEDEDSSDGSER